MSQGRSGTGQGRWAVSTSVSACSRTNNLGLLRAGCLPKGAGAGAVGDRAGRVPELEELAVHEAREENQHCADLSDDQSHHVPVDDAWRGDRISKLVVGVAAPAVVGVARDRADEEDVEDTR